jgi:hypothetical protein
MLGRCAVVVAAVALGAACSGHARPKPLPSPHASARPTSTPRPTPTIAYDETACKGGVPFYAASPTYSGAGPHRVLGFNLGIDPEAADAESNIVPPDSPALLPDSWAANYQDAVPAVFEDDPLVIDYEHAQLALCMSPPAVTHKVIGTCAYTLQNIGGGSGTPVDVVSASYEFRLYETRTGRLVTSFRLTASDPSYCPVGISSGQLREKIAAEPDHNSLEVKLRPYVEGRAPTG